MKFVFIAAEKAVYPVEVLCTQDRVEELRGHQSLWALSHSTPVHRRLPNAYFAERGLVSLVERWRELQTRAAIAPAQLTLPLG